MTNEAFTLDLVRLQQALAGGEPNGRMSFNSTPPQAGSDYDEPEFDAQSVPLGQLSRG